MMKPTLDDFATEVFNKTVVAGIPYSEARQMVARKLIFTRNLSMSDAWKLVNRLYPELITQSNTANQTDDGINEALE